MSKTVLMINKFYWAAGGAETHMLALSKELQSRGNNVIPFSMKDIRNLETQYESYFVSNVSYDMQLNIGAKFKAGLRSVYNFEARKRLNSLIANTKPDIAHIHNFNYQLTPSILLELKKHKIPVVQTLHDPNIVCPNHRLYDYALQQICEDCSGGKFYKAVNRRCMKNSVVVSAIGAIESYLYHWLGIYKNCVDIYICPSNFLKLKIENMGMKNLQIKVLPNFAMFNKSFPVSKKIRKKFTYIGRLSEEKGILFLIKAAQKLPKIAFNIIGSGPQETNLKEYCKKHQIENVNFVGYMDKGGVERELQDSIALVLPSQLYENCPMTILEAYCSGTPVLGANLGGITELVKDGITGFLFDPRDSNQLASLITRLWNNPEEAKVMGQQAREFAKANYDIDTYVDSVEQIYNSLLYPSFA